MNVIICLLIIALSFEKLGGMDNADNSQKPGKSMPSVSQKNSKADDERSKNLDTMPNVEDFDDFDDEMLLINFMKNKKRRKSAKKDSATQPILALNPISSEKKSGEEAASSTATASHQAAWPNNGEEPVYGANPLMDPAWNYEEPRDIGIPLHYDPEAENQEFFDYIYSGERTFREFSI